MKRILTPGIAAERAHPERGAVGRQGRASRKLMGLLLAACITGCSSYTVTNRYDSLAEARAEQLFERGWLPDILPPSAYAIRTTNDLDHNTSNGEFSFSPSQGDRFYERLTPGAPDRTGSTDWSETVASYQRRDYSAWSHRMESDTWAFFCTPSNDKCDYFLW